jgi:predicted nucleic acid-binding Zn ribbon protein
MADPTLKPCVVCGKMFQKRTNALCCSKTCSREHKRALDHVYSLEHSAEKVERVRLWRIANREKWLLNSRIRTARQRAGSAMPLWVNHSEINRFYIETPEGMIVDHKVPLAVPGLGFSYFDGREVCGLHVPWNLQHITQSENTYKTDEIFKRNRQRQK